MRKLSKFGIWSVSIFAGLYGLFLLSPLIVTPILNSKTDLINDIVEQSTGFKSDIEGISFVTSWNFSAGVKVKELKLTLPESKQPFFYAQNTGAKLSLIPVLSKKIQLDSVFSDAVYADINVKKDGSLLLLDYLPKTEEKAPETFELPLGLKLSNHLPNLFVKSYRLAIIDAKTDKNYILEGEDFKVTNFVLDKSVKFSSKGKVVFDNTLISNYDLKIDNRIMPNLQLQDLVFPKEIKVDDTSDNSKNSAEINIKDVVNIFETTLKNQFGANITADLKTKGSLKTPDFQGALKIDGLTVASRGKKLPESYLNMIFKGHKTEIDSIFYTSADQNEKTQIIGDVHSGKKPSVDITLRSNAKFTNIINLIDSIASSCGMNDFNTLSATGSIDADFNINSDMKKVSSNGYLKVAPSSFSYGLYNVKIDNITADVNLENNNIDIKKAGFSILGNPLNFAGTIMHDSTADLKLTGSNLPVKGLLTAFGQAALLKDNDIKNGNLSLDVIIKGKLKEIKPEIMAKLDKLNIYNKPAQAKATLDNAVVTLVYNGLNATGNVDVNSLNMNISGSSISVPKALIAIEPQDIVIKNSYVMLNNSKIDVSGNVKNYMDDKMSIDLNAKGSLQSSDVAAFLPKDFRNLISYKGKMPLSITATGNTKVQNIKAELTANPSNYISLIDINALKGQQTKIHSNIEIIGDSLTFTNTGISNNKTTIAILSGGISKLYSSPKLNLNLSVPNIISFPIWGMGSSSNISANGNVSIVGDMMNPNLRGTVNLTDISIKDMDFSISDMVADLSGAVLNGSATAKQFKFGGIVANDLTGNFSLNDYSKFYLNDLSGKAFDGNVKGKLSYDINGSKIALDFTGSGLNSTKAVEGAVGIKNALTGVLGFSAKLGMQGYSDRDIINSMKGNVNFNISDGRFVSIGKLENLVAAQNINSNSILKSAISALATLSAVQEADRFKTITGEMTLSNGNANISKILVAGPLMSYFVKGTYYILPNSANLIILGRLESKVVSALGPLGQLSADKLLGYIPKFGVATANILKQLTADPANENTAMIPDLSNGSKTYKDFKVTFNGPVESTTSVRNFKWLSNCDTTEMNLKKDIENAKEAVKTNITNRVEDAKTRAQNVQKNVTNIVETQKKQVETVKKDIEQTKTDLQNAKENSQQSAENLKNLFNNALKNSVNKMPEPETTQSPAVEGN